MEVTKMMVSCAQNEEYNKYIFEKVMRAHQVIISKFSSLETPSIEPVTGDIREDGIILQIFKIIVSKRDNIFEKLKLPDIKIKDLPYLPVPIEMFGNAFTISHRWDLFFKRVDFAKILTFQVINVTLKDSYKLLVVEEPGYFSKLDDLGIIMYLPKTAEEKIYLNDNDLQAGEYIRAAVNQVDYLLRHIYVTLNPAFSLNGFYTLGRISKEILPIWIGKEYKNMSFNDYLQHHGALEDSCWAESFSTLKIDRTHIFSFFNNWNRKEFPTSQYASSIGKLRKLNFCEIACYLASDFKNKKLPTEAISILSDALALYPISMSARFLRARLYKSIGNLRNAVLDVEEILKIEPENLDAKMLLSEFLVSAAKEHLTQNNIKNAQEALLVALTLNRNNEEAGKVLSNLKFQIENYEEDLSSISSTSNKEEFRPYSPTDDHKQKCENFLKSINSPETPTRRHKKSHKHHSSHRETSKKNSHVKKHGYSFK